MGRPDRLLNSVFFGRYQSPFLWDFTCIGIYILSSAVYLYLPMLPDLALMRDRLSRRGRLAPVALQDAGAGLEGQQGAAPSPRRGHRHHGHRSSSPSPS